MLHTKEPIQPKSDIRLINSVRSLFCSWTKHVYMFNSNTRWKFHMNNSRNKLKNLGRHFVSYLVDAWSAKPHELIKKQESWHKCIFGLKIALNSIIRDKNEEQNKRVIKTLNNSYKACTFPNKIKGRGVPWGAGLIRA